MPTWNSRGLRGSHLEEIINRTNQKYKENNLALIQKVPTPITPVKIDSKSRHITLAYFDQKSTIDYIGAVQGLPVCFDAKECAVDTFSLQNIHEHQVEFMEKFEQQEGISFLLIYYSHKNIFCYLTFKKLNEFWKRGKNGGRKSFRFDELNADYLFESSNGYFIPYLEFLQKDLDSRD
ncbi:Holliday junction resolvase RecU [Anaerosacchariphilus polymeriproducens]|uniref:Holliday junction resolvase RecU n=1 Tax=Anaerosacchariphilus polymeriproducens TaxID=1812858 RepID=A0A371ATZ0_9FIRM|nr:Holliday junction resolvase RecU [Anaerosacchariphilus polymeriproducens]RDU23028.1 Holliday junction resolvase RecU [Anaerosacchariphilus polymeriproducens]